MTSLFLSISTTLRNLLKCDADIPASLPPPSSSIVSRLRDYCAFHVLVQLNFRRYYFYFLPDQVQILLNHFNFLEKTLVPNFNWIRQQMKNFPRDPHCKNCPRAIFTMGVYGEILYPLLDSNEIWHQSLSKTFQRSR